jgi:dCTP deaminase
MSFWSGERLLANKSVIVPFIENQVDCNSYTLRMGSCYCRTADRESGIEQKKTFLADQDSFLIPPGQFAYLLSKEEVAIPNNAMAFISMRTGIKFQGLINVSGFHVDPGYRGKLIYAVYNASPSPALAT